MIELPRGRACRARRIGAVLFCLLLSTMGCGPAGIGSGIAALADSSRDREVVFVFRLFNPLTTPLDVRVLGDNVDEVLVVLPGTEALLSLPNTRGERLRVVAAESVDPEQSGFAPVRWDYDFTANGAGARTEFELESQIVASRYSTTAGGAAADRFEFQRFDRNAVAFGEVATWQLDFEPVASCVHPSGAYIYTLGPIDGSTDVELRAWRVDARTGNVDSLGDALDGLDSARLAVTDAIELTVSDGGQFLYALDHDDIDSRTHVTAWRVAADGSLTEASQFIRGRIADLRFDPGGVNAYVGERFTGTFSYTAFRIDANDGSFDFPVASTSAPCSGDTAIPDLHVDPDGQFLYITTPEAALGDVDLASYQLFGDGSVQASGQCLGLDAQFDVGFDPTGHFLFISGTDATGTTGIVPYAIDAVSGELAAQSTNVFAGSVSRVFGEREPSGAGELPNAVVYIAIDDTLVPHAVGPNGELTAMTSESGVVPTLPYGSPTSTRTIQTLTRGCVQHEDDE